jgi:hypothetical protein
MNALTSFVCVPTNCVRSTPPTSIFVEYEDESCVPITVCYDGNITKQNRLPDFSPSSGYCLYPNILEIRIESVSMHVPIALTHALQRAQLQLLSFKKSGNFIDRQGRISCLISRSQLPKFSRFRFRTDHQRSLASKAINLSLLR